MRVLIYGRVSQDPRQQGRSVDEQITECREWAEREGWVVARVIRETGSASRFARVKRDDWASVMRAIEDGEMDALLTWESSRAMRDMTAYAELRDACVAAGVQWGYSGQLHDLTSRDGRFRTGLDALLAEDEAARTSERLRRTTRHAALAGRPHGKNLYGYLRVYDPQTRQLLHIEPHPEQAPVVKEAARRVMAGETQYQIAKSFNQRGIQPRRASYKEHRKNLGWTAVAIKQMLIQPAYTGLRQHRGEIAAEAVWPALIERADWEKLQAILFDPSRGRLRNDTAVHLLTGIAKCADCGNIMRVGLQNYGRPRVVVDASGERKVREKYHTYMCQGAPGKGGFHTTMKCEFLDHIVVEAVVQRLSMPDAVNLLGATRDEHASERADLREEIERHQAWLEAVRQRAMKEHNLDLLFDQEARVKPLIEAAQRRLERLLDLDPAVSKMMAAGDLRRHWDGSDLNTRRRIIRALVTPRVARAEARGVTSEEAVLRRVTLVWH